MLVPSALEECRPAVPTSGRPPAYLLASPLVPSEAKVVPRRTASSGLVSGESGAAEAIRLRLEGDLEEVRQDDVRVRPALIGHDRDRHALVGQPADRASGPQEATGVAERGITCYNDTLNTE